MKKPLAIALMMLLIGSLIFVGCAPKKVAPSGETAAIPSEQADVKRDEAPRPATKDDIRKIPPGETITERELVKAQPSDIESTIKEIQKRLRDVYFEYDRYDLSDDGKSVIKELSQILSKNKNLKVIIEGHCDERGTNEYNLGLGQRRAQTVKNYLMSLGISSKNIETVSYGEEKPVCKESNEACWAKNRRAHFVLIGDR